MLQHTLQHTLQHALQHTLQHALQVFTACKRCRKNQKLKRIVETKEKSKKRVGDENWLENLYWQIVQWWRKVIEWSLLRKVITFSEESALRYGVATTCRLFKIIGLFCKRALLKRKYLAKKTYKFELRYIYIHSSDQYKVWQRFVGSLELLHTYEYVDMDIDVYAQCRLLHKASSIRCWLKNNAYIHVFIHTCIHI